MLAPVLEPAAIAVAALAPSPLAERGTSVAACIVVAGRDVAAPVVDVVPAAVVPTVAVEAAVDLDMNSASFDAFVDRTWSEESSPTPAVEFDSSVPLVNPTDWFVAFVAFNRGVR